MSNPTCAFVTCLTPTRLMTPLRRQLRHLTYQALASQTCGDWMSISVGQPGGYVEELTWNNATCLPPDEGTKAQKQPVGWQAARRMEPRFVCKLDDDDWLHPTALERAIRAGADVYADRVNWHFDVVTGRWLPFDKGPVMLPNTVFHAIEHAAARHGESPLFLRTHSAWGPYYEDKHKAYAAPHEPVYVRVVHPDSTSVAGQGLRDNTLSAHRAYCRMKARQAGRDWQDEGPPGFEAHARLARQAWESAQQVAL